MWWQGLGFGCLYGLATVLVVILAEGGFKRKRRSTLLIAGVVTGAVIGLLDVFLGRVKETDNLRRVVCPVNDIIPDVFERGRLKI